MASRNAFLPSLDNPVFNSTPLSIILSYHSYIFSIMKESHIAYPFTKALIIYL